MKKSKRWIAVLLTLALSTSLFCTSVYAVSEKGPSNEEYTYAYLLPATAENVQYVNNGTILFKDGNEYKYIDGQTGQIIVAATEHRIMTRSVTVNHTPINLLPMWEWYHTDGPYETDLDWFAIMDALNDINDWMGVSVWLGLPAAAWQWLKGQADGGYKQDSYWRIDDSYWNLEMYGDAWPYTMIHIESYYFSDAACTNQFGHDTHEMSAGA